MTFAASPARVALVTGAGRGIGAALCIHLARNGFHVVPADIDAANADKVAASLGDGHLARAVDVADEAAVTALFDDVETRIGPVGVLICAAGLLLLPGGARPLIADLQLDTWERSFAVNARGAFLCSREWLRRRNALPVEHGRAVFFGSVAAQLGGYRSSAAYIAAKAAVMGYAKAFAREAAPLGMTANVIAPGLIDTEMLRSTVTGSGALAVAAQSIPLGRIGTVQDVVAAVSYLLSPAAAYITGSVIDVNGGYRMQ
ncbi:SDR family NAD(P)-dependent oxidoreductase [Verminephrobacter eiseniae]|uniref:SDR family NAD(P)-dependent oxidoreductase n=1 Tax=Verminephrobacter eiseniae TaxID=364317 RepID=UPI0005A50A8E|nr:SDR family oxidoreductase [Verminephrobacter eiseniae]MCW5283541.1 SDR family oxidoreductase [Verminephrobacter eiseniae]MCW5301250.1 SDR family oxidoreductase [Verminephrobacter eiseniae]MCW8179811.1 SDR family oxidoreductase [Verminephrobacter eiseniae]MCW8189142.1 SDR family oxidoreductase [Verminephrobacter eiseniae]